MGTSRNKVTRAVAASERPTHQLIWVRYDALLLLGLDALDKRKNIFFTGLHTFTLSKSKVKSLVILLDVDVARTVVAFWQAVCRQFKRLWVLRDGLLTGLQISAIIFCTVFLNLSAHLSICAGGVVVVTSEVNQALVNLRE